jgi:hypothetical protein
MSSSPVSSPRQFSCAKSDASSCPSTPSPNSPTSTTSTSSRVKEEAYYALMTETTNLHAEVEALREQLDYYHQQQQEQSQKQQQSPKDWIRENLEEAQRIIDNIVGIKGITEDPLGAAIKMGISQPQHEPEPQSEPQPQQQQYSVRYHDYQAQMPRVSISSSIVPSNEELYGY